MTTKTLMFALTVAIGFSLNANAATFIVNTTADTQDAAAGNGICADSGGACSLRAAITEANALPGADIITLPAGTYTQALAATGEDLNAGGDFDITSPMTINGARSGTTIIQANVLPGSSTEGLSIVSVRNKRLIIIDNSNDTAWSGREICNQG